MISLDDIGYLRKDTKAKSLSYYYKGTYKTLTLEMIDAMIYTASIKKQNVRVNFHDNSDSLHHDMIILQWKNTYVRPHKHQNKPESCYIVKGEHYFIVFDESGSVIDKVKMDVNKCPFYKVSAGSHHMSIPISDYVIFYESKPGPYLNENDSVFPEWAPVQDSIDQYISSILV